MAVVSVFSDSWKDLALRTHQILLTHTREDYAGVRLYTSLEVSLACACDTEVGKRDRDVHLVF